MGVILDISKRKEAESQKEAAHKALQESEKNFRELFDASPDGIVIIGTDGRITNSNITQARMYRYNSPSDLIGVHATQLVSPSSRQHSAQIMQRRLNGENIPAVEYELVRKDGTTFYGETSVTILRNSDGKILGYICTTRDTTERKLVESQREAALEEISRLNTELEQKVAERTMDLHDSQLALLNLVDDLNQSAKNTDLINRKLEETNKELGAFSYSVSHDLRAPLRSIDGFSLALLEDYEKKLDDTGKKYLHKIRAATQHMGLLIEDMLKLSRITHAEFHHQSIDLSKIVQSISETFQQNNPGYNMKMIIQKGIVIKGDLHSMQIAMTNLLENALKFTGKQKHPLIEFGMTLTDGKKVFFVRDNGAGFDMAYAGKLFGAFQRLHSTDDFPGTGIGLATVKRIITRHGGQLWAEGEVGKGATFFFTIPE
jgi:PAS domain S-box-containing protein